MLSAWPSREAHILLPPADAPIEGGAQIGILCGKIGAAVITEIDGRLQISVKALKIVNFASDLGVFQQRQSSCHIELRFPVAERNAPLIDNALILLFELQKNLIVRTNPSVAAQTQFLFVDRLIQRLSDEAVIRRVVIDVANAALAVRIGPHVAL